MLSTLQFPESDPTPIFEHFRGNYGAELLTAAVAHFHLFDVVAQDPRTFADLRGVLQLDERPAHVLLTAMRAMGLLHVDEAGRFGVTPLSREHLVREAHFDVSGYIGLAADTPNVKVMVALLRSNRPLGSQPAGDGDDDEAPGTAFIFKEGERSAMEAEASARHLTMSLAGRACNVAPYLAERVDLAASRVLLDVGGGSGLYSIACLEKNQRLRAIVWDRPEVLRVAREMAVRYGVADRLECCPGDMFRDPVPAGADCILLSNILHDWDVPECELLLRRCADALPSDGRLLVHDVYMNDSLDGPLPIALYSAALFSLTEGRAYSAAEYRDWIRKAGMRSGDIIPTLVHCGVLPCVK